MPDRVWNDNLDDLKKYIEQLEAEVALIGASIRAIEFGPEEAAAIENMNVAMGALRSELPESIWNDVDRRYRALLATFAVRKGTNG